VAFPPRTKPVSPIGLPLPWPASDTTCGNTVDPDSVAGIVDGTIRTTVD
jgi:hypothetical protein